MIEQSREPQTSERLNELRNLDGEIKRLAAARSLSLPAVGITSAAAAVFGTGLLGPLVVLGTSGLGAATVAISRQLLTNRTKRALALAQSLRDEGAISEEEFAEHMRSVRNASEGSPVRA